MKTKNKIATLCLALAMVVGILFAGSASSVSAATGPAPSDWAFEESSRELNDAIVAAYPALGDANGYVTITAANTVTDVLDVSNQGISGTMHGIENFVQVKYLYLQNNQLTGNIPVNINNLASVLDIRINNNQLSGEIPVNIGSIASLKQLHLNNNNLTGDIPAELLNLNNLFDLRLNFNELSGEIPANIDDLGILQYLYLDNNKFEGQIPSEIGNLPQLKRLYLNVNQLVGEIPSNLGNLSNVEVMNLSSNSLTGSIPTTIGGLTMIKTLYLSYNQLSGEIPTSIGSLTNITSLSLADNQLTGEIPTTFSSLIDLGNLYIQNNKLTGKIDAIKTLPLIKLNLSGNIDLIGNPVVDFASNTTLVSLDIRGTSLIQASPEIPTLGYTVGTFLYDNLASDLLTTDKTNLNGEITQADINKAQESADFIADSTEKQQWQDDIDLAQKMLDAKNKVDTLLVTPDLNDLNPGITINDINDAQDLVTALPNGSLKDELQAKIDTAKNIVDAKKKTEGLLNPDGSLAGGVDQGKINDAQEAVNKLANGTVKTELQKIIDLAQKQLNQKNSITEPLIKPSVSGGDEIVKSSVSTGDATNLSILYAMLGTSLFGLIVSFKRRKTQGK